MREAGEMGGKKSEVWRLSFRSHPVSLMPSPAAASGLVSPTDSLPPPSVEPHQLASPHKSRAQSSKQGEGEGESFDSTKYL